MGKELEARKGYTLFLQGENALMFWGDLCGLKFYRSNWEPLCLKH